MTLNNPFNVYKGADSVQDYHDPEKAPFLPLVEIPHHINPFHDHGVRIYAKMMNALPAHNIKELPALNLLREHKKPTTKTIIEYSSGSTIISLAVLSRVLYGITDTWAYVSNKTNLTKLRLLQFFGLQLKLFGGPSTPDPDDPRGGIKAAENVQAQDDTVLNPNQYVSEANWKSHTLWTGPQLLKQLPEIGVLCAAMGTTGTISGVGTYLKTHKPSLQCLGVCIAPGNEVPGPRMFSMIQKIDFPWRGTIDALEEIDAPSSYATSIDLCRQGIICGPSSGMGYQGLKEYLGKQTASGGLSSLRDSDGLVHAVFLCCDLPYQYVDEYYEILGERYFAPIINENLFGVDRYTYSSEWELTPSQCKEMIGVDLGHLETLEDTSSTLHTQGRSIQIVDLRSAQDFATQRINGSSNIPLDSLSLNLASPFADANIMESQWKELERRFSKTNNTTSEVIGFGDMCQILLVCYTGDTARVGTSILRANGVNAFSLKEGILGLGLRGRTKL